jgi:hypothetical protein
MRDLLDEIEENIADAKEMVERSKPLLKGDLAAESTRRREAKHITVTHSLPAAIGMLIV